MTAVRRRVSVHAAPLRRGRTEAETLVAAVPDRQLGGLKSRFQHTVGLYVADFVCIEVRLIADLDCSQHTKEGDALQTAFLAAQRLKPLRF